MEKKRELDGEEGKKREHIQIFPLFSFNVILV